MSLLERAQHPPSELSSAKRSLIEARLRGLDPRPDIVHRGLVRAPLSYGQERLWFLERLQPGSAVYNVPMAWRLDGPLDVGALERALGEIVRRHEVLRTTFAEVDGAPVQVVAPFTGWQVPVEDLSTLPPAERAAAVRQRVQADAGQPFDLGQGPLVRMQLLRLAETEHVLVLGVHHSVSDGWSLRVLCRELAALYAAYRAGQASPLPALAVQYADYAVWQREQLSTVLGAQLTYWRAQLAGAPALLALPTDRPRPAVQSYRGAHERRVWPRALLGALQALARREGTTLYMVLLAAFQVLLGKYSGSEDVVVGSPIAGRTRKEVEPLIGFFVNTLVLRTNLAGNPSLREVVRRVREVTLAAYEHQDLPFEHLVAELQPARSLSHSPLFQVLFMLDETEGAGPELAGLQLQAMSAATTTTKFDLMAGFGVQADGFQAVLTYSTDLFEAATIQRMLAHLERVLEQIATDPDRRLSELTLLDTSERTLVTETWNQTHVSYPAEQCLHELFEAQVRERPHATAVRCEEEALTYEELNARANQLAHYLRRLGVGAEARVGICLERSLDMVVAILGVLKAGGCYVPLDPSYPAERLTFMVTDADVRVVVTRRRLRELIPGPAGMVTVSLDDQAPWIAAERAENPTCEGAPWNLAYVIYTSGSTGTPKGVGVEHRSVRRLVCDASYVDLGPDEVMLQAASVSFDASTLELWGALLNGARLVVVPGANASLEELSGIVKRSGVTTLWLTAGLFQAMADEQLEAFAGVRQLLAGGDVLPAETVKKVRRCFPGLRLINGYGPTENTTFTCCYTIPELWSGALVPIGHPISNTQVYVLDDAQEPVPVGVPGELYAGGAGVARGYVGRPAPTAERFVPDPFDGKPGRRLYRTGDRVRWRPDGTLEFLGRADRQVKIRGFRVEPGEIEAALMTDPAVREARVVAREDVPGEPRLVAYVVGDVEADHLRARLRRTLPEYMLPAAFVRLGALPLTPNGKLNAQALPAPSYAAPLDYGGLKGIIELQLLQMWEELLQVSPIGPTQNFFEVGGDSLLLIRLLARIKQRLQCDLPVSTLFDAGTVRRMAEAIAERKPSDAAPESTVLPLRSAGSLPPLFCVHPADRRAVCYVNLTRHVGAEQPVFGLQDTGDDLSRPVTQLAFEYVTAIRSVQPIGPYYLAGWSYGGFVAHAMATLLESQGHTVAFLGLLDTIEATFVRNLTLDDLDLLTGVAHELAVQARCTCVIPREALAGLDRGDRIRHVVEALHADGVPESVDAGVLNEYCEMVKARHRSVCGYAPGSFAGTITLFRASDRDAPWERTLEWTEEEAWTLGWCRNSSKVNVHAVPGAHSMIGREPYVRVLAQRLREALADARERLLGSRGRESARLSDRYPQSI